LYDFHLPPSLIAQRPPQRRGDSRLLILERSSGRTRTAVFAELDRFLPPGALLVLNDARVVPARLLGRLADRAGSAELLVLEPPLDPTPGPREVWCLGKPGKRLTPGARLIFEPKPTLDGPAPDDRPAADEPLAAEVVAQDGPRRLVKFFFADSPLAVLERLGHLPLPPYIKRPDQPDDFLRYQTVYAAAPGAVAAPTAGLHFTAEHLARLAAADHALVTVTLRVGAGTFAPLTAEHLRAGRLHEEFVEVSPQAAQSVREARAQGRPVVAVGTTAARALEWAAEGGTTTPKKGFTSLFIRPGWTFKAVDALLTNFHLPGSSLLMLVAALAGREQVLKAYELAVREKFRFYSYGDAMLVI
jgi:S-adenosylmethionine:tRNA ribosyltransferase-isomerase